MDDEKRKLIEKLEAIERKYEEIVTCDSVYSYKQNELFRMRDHELDNFEKAYPFFKPFGEQPPSPIHEPNGVSRKDVYTEPEPWLTGGKWFLVTLLWIPVTSMLSLPDSLSTVFACLHLLFSIFISIRICEKNYKKAAQEYAEARKKYDEYKRKYDEYKRKADAYNQARNKHEEEKKKRIREYGEKLDEPLQKKLKDLSDAYNLHREKLKCQLKKEADGVYYYKYSSLNDIITVLKQGRADTLKEAINIVALREERKADLGLTNGEHS